MLPIGVLLPAGAPTPDFRSIARREGTPRSKGNLQSTTFDHISCAEEYMFYELGYIREEAWQAWLEGMRYYYENNDQIRALWEKELEQNSYYGFTSAHLRRKPPAEHLD
jgi:hypothetical protein